MPLYDWSCLECEEVFKELLKYDEHPDVCPRCGNRESDKLKKVLSAPIVRTVGGLSSMSVKHTTSEYFGPQGRLGKEEYFPEERKRKAQELKKKEQSKGATVIVNKPLKN